MRHILFILIVLLMANNKAKAQTIEDDSLLLQVVQELPYGWTANLTDSIFSIEYNDSVWLQSGNWINAETRYMERRDDSLWIKTNGRPINQFFKFQVITKMDVKSIERRRELEKNNDRRWTKNIYNSQSFTLLFLSSPQNDTQFQVIWPKKFGVRRIYEILQEYLIII